MIPGISYWSFEQGLANTHPLDDALAGVQSAGLQALELSIGPEGLITVETPEAECRRFREQIDAAGVHVSTAATGMTWGLNPTSEDPAVREKSIAMHAAALERAAWLGCEALLMVPGVVTSPIAPDQCVRYDVAIERCREAVTELLRTAERVGVDLCLENVWNGMLLTPLEWAAFLDGFDSPRVGMYFDVGNLLGYHQHPPHWIELLGDRIKRVHVKDFKLEFGWQGSFDFCRLGEGDVPWPETFAALRSIGYDSTVIAEMLPHSPGLIEHTGAALNKLMKAG